MNEYFLYYLPMFKPYTMLLHFIRKEETENWSIPLDEMIRFTRQLSQTAEQLWFECYVKPQKKEVLDYIPSGNTYTIKTLEDIAKLTEDQFEMMIDDLREWCNISKNVDKLKWLWLDVRSSDCMTWIDSWKYEATVKIGFEVSNKL